MTTFIIAMVVVGLFVSVFMNFFSELNDQYVTEVEYNSTDWERYNQLSQLKSDAKAIQSQTDDISEESGVLDVIGSYFSSAYNAFKITRNSYNSFEVIADTAVEDANLGENAETFRTTLITIVLIIIFVGIVLSALLKFRV
jgi:hypothetical protein